MVVDRRESPRARRAWLDYLALGEDRSLADYRNRTEPGPTRQLSRLKEWSRAHGWQLRLAALADQAAAAAAAAVADRRRAALLTGLALDHERVRALKRVAERLLREIEDEGRLWVVDAKGSRRFNAPEVEQFRGLLADIARETGGRAHDANGRTYDEAALREMAVERGLDPDEFVSTVARVQRAMSGATQRRGADPWSRPGRT